MAVDGGEAYCVSRGYQLVETNVEPGASATNDRRPEFQRMIGGLKAIRDQAKADPERAQAMLENSGSKAVTRRWCASSPKPRGGISALKGVAIALTIFARSPSALRSRMARSGSWDRSPGCTRC